MYTDLTLMEAINLWEQALRDVRSAKHNMEQNFYYFTYREAYEAAVDSRDELDMVIKRLLSETEQAS